MAERWCEFVNTMFYGQNGEYKDNTEKVEFKSGREIVYLKNSVPKKSHTLNLRCQDKGTPKIAGKTEFEHFLYWFENTVKSGTIPFLLTDIVTGTGERLYKIEVTGWTGQRYKEVSLKLKEV